MKYWLLTSEYPPFFGGGISTYCYFTAKMITNAGHKVTVFVNDDSIKTSVTQKIDGVRIIRFNPTNSSTFQFLGHTTNISYAFADIVKHTIENEGPPDIIEAQEYLGIGYYLLLQKRLLESWCCHIPVVITMHSPSFLYMMYNHISEYQYPNYWICEMERFCLQAADLVIAPSQYILTELKKYFKLTQNRVAVIPNPYQSEKQVHTQSTTNGKIVFYGKLTAQKGAFELLSYFDALWQKGFKETLTLIGGQDIVYHPEERTMGDIIRTKYKTYIDSGLLCLEPKITPTEIRNRLSGAGIVIVPSNNDNLPYVIFEMMSLGNIVLTSKQGGQSEVITHGVDGFLFDHECPETFAQCIYQILALTESERTTIGAAAMKKLASYSMQSIYPLKMEVLQPLLSNKSISTSFPFIRPLEKKVEVKSGSSIKGMLSIIVPYYNMGKFIGETMNSLAAVEYEKKEIIIINDGSSDKTSIAKLEEYRDKPGIRIIDSENRGLALARNLGTISAKGEFIAFLDADDLVHPRYYSKAIEVLTAYANVYFVGAWTQYFEGSKKAWPTFTPEPPLILYHNLVNSSSLVFKRSAFLAAGSNDSKMVFQGWEDYEMVIAMVSAGLGGVVLPELLFYYRVRAGSMIRHVSANKKVFLIQYIARKHKFIYANFAPEMVNLLNANGPGYKLDNPSLDKKINFGNPLFNRVVHETISIAKKNPFLKKVALAAFRKLKP